MSCGNSKQQLERAGVNALAICKAPYRNSDGIITECGCPFGEHLNEIVPQAQPAAEGVHETLTITIRHWETLSINSITLSKTSSYHLFEAQVGELFSDAIGSNDFRLYTLPFESEELDEKLRLTAENFSEFVDHKFSGERPRRVLYVSNTGWTPTKLPVPLTIDNMRTMSGAKRKLSSVDSKSNTTSQVSRSSKNALRCKKRDKFTCRMCQYYTDNEFAQTKQLEAAHIYEIEELKAISDDEKRTRILEEMELYDINHPMNLITLCQVCHGFFDKQQIGIDPKSRSWIITTSIANTSTLSGRSYKVLHGMTVGFGVVSNLALLVHRYERFTAEEYSKEVVSVIEIDRVAEEMNSKLDQL